MKTRSKATLTPVSYTHLGGDRRGTRGRRYPAMGGRYGGMRMNFTSSPFEPVSYTHLDVYKRQPCNVQQRRKDPLGRFTEPE